MIGRPSDPAHAPAPAGAPRATLPLRRWRQRPVDPAACERLRAELGVHPLMARLLVLRGQASIDVARSFVEPKLSGLHPPETLPDVDRAVERIRAAIEARDKICIYGDYDVDGISATALLQELFVLLGAEVETYIPHRLREGYGLNADAVRRIAAGGARLVITVDGGSNDLGELALAAELGVDAIVTDHHPIHGSLPTVPVVHPGRRDRPAPFAGLSGVGVAYKLVWALGKDLSGSDRVSDEVREFLLDALGFVALGTVADVVPLLDENRVLVSYGLRALGRTRRVGLRALMARCQIRPEAIRAEDIAFKLAPHLNAAGRLGRAEEALRLLVTRDEDEAEALARSLASANRRRKEIERSMLEACEAQLADTGTGAAALVLAGEGWHPGVAGIVASRLVDRYHRPAFVIGFADGLARGSCRSTPEMPLEPAYEAARAATLSIGGHACAGGLTLDSDRIDEFRERVIGAFDEAPAVGGAPLDVDATLELRQVDVALIEALALLEPHGHDNRLPRFRIDGLELAAAPRLVGKGEEHLALTVRHGGRVLRAIFFRGAPFAHPLRSTRRPFSMVCELAINEYRGSRSAELRVIDLDVDAASEEPPVS